MNNLVTYFRAGMKPRDYGVQILLHIDVEIKVQRRAEPTVEEGVVQLSCGGTLPRACFSAVPPGRAHKPFHPLESHRRI